MPGITVMTDFGIKDGTVGVTKRVSGEICPETQNSYVSQATQGLDWVL